jgi:hypothetical protein
MEIEMNAAITKSLIADITVKCGISEERAAKELKAAKAAAKATGLTLAEVLVALGLV